jgi:hypothetical protein
MLAEYIDEKLMITKHRDEKSQGSGFTEYTYHL